MRVEQLSELTIENLQTIHGEYPEEIELIIGSFNELIRSYNLLSNQRISLQDNIDCDVRTVTVKGGAELKISRSKLFLPRHIVVGRVKTSGPPLTAPVQILDWSIVENEIIITNLVGLTVDQSYDITLTIYY